MIKERGKDERLTKVAVGQLLEYLRTGKDLNKQTKEKLEVICEAILQDKPIYDRSEKGRKEEASFQSKTKRFFFTYLLSKARINQNRIIDLVPGEVRNISRMVKTVEKRLEKANSSDNKHWYQLGDGYLEHYYAELLQEQSLKNEECKSIEKFIEKVSVWTSIATSPNNITMVSREDLRLKIPTEREDFLEELRLMREYYLQQKSKSKKRTTK